MDFAGLPPEVNSGRMYAGAGAGPLVAAATAWDSLASELNSAASSYHAAVSALTSEAWKGPSSTSMAAAAAPYLDWMHTTATQAEQTANQARAAVAAYESAFIATVPPPVIAANRALLTMLVATNIVGQNTPAIAATESHYAEMWAQDAAAMYGYAANSAAATQLAPFKPAPQNTDPAATSAQAAAVSQATSTTPGNGASQLLSTIPNTLQTMAAGDSIDPITWLENLLTSPLNQALNTFLQAAGEPVTYATGPMFAGSGILYTVVSALMNVTPVPAMAEVPEAALGAGLMGSVETGASDALGLGGAGVSASVGEAASVAGLSVPPSWATAAPEIRLASTSLPTAGLTGLPEAATGPGGWFGGMPPVGSVVNAPRHGESGSRYNTRAKVVAQMPGESSAEKDSPGRWMPSRRQISEMPSELSEHERNELDQLRKEFAELAMERDAAARLIKEAIRP